VNFLKNTDQIKINRALRLLDSSFKLELNKIKKNSNNPHEMLKEKIAKELIKDGKTILTEVRFKKINGRSGRCDILNLSDGIIIEILDSEKEERFNSKLLYYPTNFKIIKIYVGD